jgi:hypothetical protein
MRLTSLRDAQKRDKYLSLLRKYLLQRLRKPRNCKPVFVFGKQRSGTSMLMFAFHRHPEALVFDEHRDDRVYRDFRIRSLDVIQDVISESRFQVVCFKPICDSHLIGRFVQAFPDAHHIWIYRQYQDVASSTLRKFESATRAIQLVSTGQPGGGWFDEGLSVETRRTLMRMYRPDLSDFELSCLVWWARNRIVMECGLLPSSDVTVLKYEELVANPGPVLRWLFARMNVPFHRRIGARMTPRSIGKHSMPQIDEEIRGVCDNLMHQLDDAFLACSPPPTVRNACPHTAR